MWLVNERTKVKAKQVRLIKYVGKDFEGGSDAIADGLHLLAQTVAKTPASLTALRCSDKHSGKHRKEK